MVPVILPAEGWAIHLRDGGSPGCRRCSILRNKAIRNLPCRYQTHTMYTQTFVALFDKENSVDFLF